MASYQYFYDRSDFKLDATEKITYKKQKFKNV